MQLEMGDSVPSIAMRYPFLVKESGRPPMTRAAPKGTPEMETDHETPAPATPDPWREMHEETRTLQAHRILMGLGFTHKGIERLAPGVGGSESQWEILPERWVAASPHGLAVLTLPMTSRKLYLQVSPVVNASGFAMLRRSAEWAERLHERLLLSGVCK